MTSEFLTLTARCLVVVRTDGVQLQQPLEAPPLHLDLGGLHLLAAVSAAPVDDLGGLVRQVAAQTGADATGLADLAFALRYGCLLMPGRPVAHAAVRDHAPAGAAAAFDLDRPQRLALRLPQVLRLRDGAFELLDHDGARRAALSAAEVHALGALLQPVEPRAALQRLAAGPAGGRLAAADFARLLGLLDGAGLLRRDSAVADGSGAAPPIDRVTATRETFDRHAAAQDAAEQARQARTGVRRPRVVPVAFDMGTPSGLGMVVAAAKAYEGGRLDALYDFRTDWLWNEARLAQFTAAPAIYLFSNYMWSHQRCIDISRRVKALSPDSITIHGGPDTPKYHGDLDAYFATHPHVDVTVRGEGEVSAAETLAALATVIGQPRPDLCVLAGVAGISYRTSSGVQHNPDRARVADLDTLPSPFLSGLFDVYSHLPDLFVTLETNRGCPYGCTFCDWGSATNSKIRQYDLARVVAELDWCARAGVTAVSVADANFGAFARDVEIARHVAALRRSTGTPKSFGFNYAKNSVKHLQPIIGVLAEAGIFTQGVLSLQSMDSDTLAAIRRTNIRTERYDALADEMRRARLPLMVELMMGLPGQTLASFAEDLQQCIDREVPARVNHTTLLVNSPMNEPAYRALHRIETAAPVGPGGNAVVVASASFSRADYAAMERLRIAFLLFEDWGVLRLVSRFVRQECALREVAFYDRLRTTCEADSAAWPALYALTELGTALMAPPYSWALVCAELRRFLVAELGLADDAALAAVLAAQHACLPAHGRDFPYTVHLAHDVVAWHEALVVAKGAGHRADWSAVVPRLATFGPGLLTVDDPNRLTDSSLGVNRELAVVGMNWELESPLSRAHIALTQMLDLVTDALTLGARAEHAPATP